MIAKLQKEINSLQSSLGNTGPEIFVDLGPVNQSFPNFKFPTAAVHEFMAATKEDAAATTGFISPILAALIKDKSAAIWISNTHTIFPPALKQYNLDPGKIIFICLKKEKEIVWVTEAALKCEALAAVVANIPNLNFTASRRLQLAVEKSKVTGFILRQTKNDSSPTACVSRWKVKSLPGEIEIPGVGFPRWKVELIKIRNGKPGEWMIEWKDSSYHFINKESVIVDHNKIAV